MRKLLKTTMILVAVALILLSATLGILSILSNSVTLDTNLLPQALANPVFFDSNGEQMDYRVASALDAEELPQNLKNAFVALEDKRFYEHNGYDGQRIVGALIANIKAGRTKEGASTITQQLIKNTHLSSEKTVSRKLNEVFLATKLEKQYSKDEILSMYLSVIYFGGGIYGVKDAADYYFGKNLSDLTVAECATLAGIVKNPSAYSPKNHLDKATKRRNLVLNLMKEQNMIDDSRLKSAVAEPTRLVNKTKIVTGEQAYLKECVREVLRTLNITRFQLENSGMTIYTHFNPDAQEILLRELKDKANYADENLEGAGALIDNKTCGVIAYYSTIPYAFRRQAGSVIKPLVAYAPSLEKGFMTIASPIEDKKTSFGGYSPSNYNDCYYGWTTPREAIKKSMNTVAVKALSYVGADVGMEYGKKFGLTLNDKDNTLALALGGLTDGVTVLEMAGGYRTLANEGRFSEPKFVRYTKTKKGDVLYANDQTQQQVISKENSAILTNVLVDTAKDGTARTLSTLPFMVASKTGTVGSNSQKHSDKPNTDAWSLSYTSAHTLAIWHGAGYTSEVGGGHPTMTARNVWDSFYQNVDSETAYPSDFVLPETVMEFEIDGYALENEQRVLIAGENTPEIYVKKELFSLFNMPTEISDIFENITVDNLSVEIIQRDNFGERVKKQKDDKKKDDFDEFERDNDFEDLEENEKQNSDEEFDLDAIEQTICYSFANPYDENDLPFYYNKIKITFDAKEIFCYKVEREINGYRTLIDNIENKKGSIEIFDTPPAFNCYATYIVTPILKTEIREIVGEPQSQVVWLSLDWLE